MSNLTVEAFRGVGKLTPLKFYKYIIKGKGKIDNLYQVINKARYQMHSLNKFKFVTIKNDVLYTLEKFENVPNLEEVDINFDSSLILDIENNTDIYSKVVEYYINLSVRKVKILNKYTKYKAQNTDEIVSNTILTRELKNEFKSSVKNFKLKRKFKIRPTVNKNGEVILFLSCSSEFSTEKNIYQMMNEGLDVIGLDVKCSWNNIKSSGTIVEISDKKINEPTTLGQSLIDYYITRKQEYRLKDFNEEDINSPVIKVNVGRNKVLDFISHSLVPIITREYLAKVDTKFSNEIEPLIKMDMNYRYNTLKDFVNDIGNIKELNNLTFNKEYYADIEMLGYNWGTLNDPILIGAKGVLKNKINVFSNGFYKIPNEQVKFGVIFPQGYEEASKKTMRAIYDFATEGKYQKEKNKYIANHLLNICFEPSECIFESYKLGDITEYKKAALKLKNFHNVQFVIAIIPNIKDEEENPYNPFKKIWAELKIPSQMISLKTAERFIHSKGISELYYLHNISLGILGKIGGIPWIVKNMPGEVDCFIGLDVGTKEKGIHYPACSVVFDRHGKLINYYKPMIPQSGEIIQECILQEIFDKILISYEEENGAYPKNIVIHRDGFSREDLSWYTKYFEAKNIKFNIIEVRKNTPLKIAAINNKIVSNPSKGSYIIKDNKAFLVTTDIKEDLGSPKPLKIERTYGDIDILTIINQIYALTQIHVGSPKSLRLPITTGYADKICKAIEFIPSGTIDNRLYFL